MVDEDSGSGVSIPQELQPIVAAVAHKVPKGSKSCAAHWALAIIEQSPDLAKELGPGLSLPDLRRRLRVWLAAGKPGPELSTADAITKAVEAARAGGRDHPEPTDLAGVVAALCRELLASEPSPEPAPSPPSDGTPAPALTRRPARRAALDQFTLDLTAAARSGKLPPIVGRDREIEMVIETLCRVNIRNPALVGPAGVGKTAIVEGLAQRIVQGDVPRLLRDVTIYSLQPPLLLAGTQTLPEYIDRVRAVIAEASAPDVVLFVDEAHALIGGGSGPAQDLVTLLKPALARGDIACIAATTDHEYRIHIEQDTALERRFQPIRVAELGPAETFEVLKAHRGRLERERHVAVRDAALRRIIALAAESMPNRHFPSKAVDVLDQTVAHCVAAGRDHVYPRDVAAIVQRLTGAPTDIRSRIEDLRRTVETQGLLNHHDLDELIVQLRVATSGLDRLPERPNAVILLQGAASENAHALAAVIADALAGSPERVVVLELSGMTHPADVARLIGSPPGYVGHGETLPIHTLIQYPRSVLVLHDIDLCHQAIASAVASAIHAGMIMDGTGREIRLCDCVALMTADRSREAHHRDAIGLRPGAARRAEPAVAAEGVPPAIARLCTIIATETGVQNNEMAADPMHSDLLNGLIERYRQQGISIEWGDGMAEWIEQVRRGEAHPGHGEDEVYRKVGDAILTLGNESTRLRVLIAPAGENLQATIRKSSKQTTRKEE